MLSKRAGIILAIVLAAVLAALIMYGLPITGEDTAGVKDVVQP
jgi:hypothetical protein